MNEELWEYYDQSGEPSWRMPTERGATWTPVGRWAPSGTPGHDAHRGRAARCILAHRQRAKHGDLLYPIHLQRLRVGWVL